VTAIQAARAAARLRADLGIEPKMVNGRYGELSVLVGGREVIRAGWGAYVGVLPSVASIVDAVREGLRSQVASARPETRPIR
jgi:hypothetical protein